jgi:hypothetical protein
MTSLGHNLARVVPSSSSATAVNVWALLGCRVHLHQAGHVRGQGVMRPSGWVKAGACRIHPLDASGQGLVDERLPDAAVGLVTRLAVSATVAMMTISFSSHVMVQVLLVWWCRLACDEDWCRILSHLVRSCRSLVMGERLVVR